ncbi:Gfo/Idh/MocA family protein [Propionibacteriaceae bacterium Y2011]|uniref:Gfo/Idh/MocA family protein n=1 Tax=Microlunatus sp. Y2014 TaxID=3418488 RepID=UPI003B4AA793
MTLPSTRIAHPSEAPAIRWGILAPGGIATAIATTMRANTRQDIVAVGSRSTDRAAEFAARFEIPRSYGSYEQLVADDAVDAILVASPHSHHAEQAMLAIEAGKHVMVQKPFTPTSAEARRIIDAARAADVTVMEAMWARCLPHLDVLRQLLADGVLGEIESVIADLGMHFAYEPEHRLFNPELAGGAMLDLGVYTVQFASFVLGTPGRVRALGTRVGTGVDRQVSMLLDRHPDHPQAHGLLNTTLAAQTPSTASISGSAGAVHLDTIFYMPNRVRWIPRNGEPELSPVPELVGREGLAYQFAHFADLVSEGRRESDLMPLDETLSVIETMERVLQAAFDD